MSEQTIQFLLNNGIAVVMVVALLYGFYLAGKTFVAAMKALFVDVVLPMKDSLVRHFDNMSEYLQKTSKAIDSLQCTLDKIDKKLPPHS